MTRSSDPAESTAELAGPSPATSAAGRPAAGRPPARRPAGPAPRWHAAGAVVRENWLAAVLLAAGLALRVLVQLAYRPALFYIDTPRYLINQAPGMDPVGYEGPLRAILLVAHFAAVAAVQHLLGPGMAVVIYLVLRRRGCARWLAALAMAPVLLDAYQLQIEQMIMPDVWFEALVVAGLAVLLWRPQASWRRVVAAGLVLGTSAIVAQIGEALLLPAVIYVVALGGGWRHAAGRTAALGLAFAVPILAYCAGNYVITGNFFLSHTGVTSFYGRAAAAADCATLRLPAAERGMCPTRAQQARGPDWLEYNQAAPIRPYYRDASRIPQTDRLISDFNHRVLTQQPLRLLSAYLRDVTKLFMVTRVAGAGDTPISRWQFQTSFPYFPPHSSRQAVQAELARFGGGPPAVWRPAAAFLRAYQLDGGYPPGPLLAVLTLAGLAGTATVLRRRTSPRTRQGALACLLFFASAGSVLLVSDLFEFSWRYQLPALITLVPAGALGIGLIIDRFAPPRARAAA